MQYTVYQIRYTDAEIDGINDGMKSMKREIRADMSMDFSGNKTVGLAEKALYEGLYTAVSRIEAEGLNQVFEIGNIGPEANIVRLSPMHSISVGDIIEDKAGARFVVATLGFVQLGS